MRRITAVTFVALALAGALLGAAPAARADDRVATALALAERYWNAVPCGGNVEITWVSLDASVNAISWWNNPVSTFGAPDRNVNCRIWLNPSQLTRWPKLCTIVVHEVGHLLGHPHDDSDPRNVMAGMYRYPLVQCVLTPDPDFVAEPASKRGGGADPPALRGRAAA